MNDQEASPDSSFERDARTAVHIGDALYHAAFDDVLKAESLKEFNKSLAGIVALKESVGVGEFLVQFFMAATPEELNQPDSVPWLAVVFDFVVAEDHIKLESKGMLVPKDNRDISEFDEYAEVPHIVIGWDDIREDFQVHEDPHHYCHHD